jgi:hypothetical protein
MHGALVRSTFRKSLIGLVVLGVFGIGGVSLHASPSAAGTNVDYGSGCFKAVVLYDNASTWANGPHKSVAGGQNGESNSGSGGPCVVSRIQNRSLLGGSAIVSLGNDVYGWNGVSFPSAPDAYGNADRGQNQFSMAWPPPANRLVLSVFCPNPGSRTSPCNP